MYELASLAKKTHPPRISSGVATLSFMISSFQLSRRCGNFEVSAHSKCSMESVLKYTGAVISVLT
jgi:hypothetical protein